MSHYQKIQDVQVFRFNNVGQCVTLTVSEQETSYGLGSNSFVLQIFSVELCKLYVSLGHLECRPKYIYNFNESMACSLAELVYSQVIYQSRQLPGQVHCALVS